MSTTTLENTIMPETLLGSIDSKATISNGTATATGAICPMDHTGEPAFGHWLAATNEYPYRLKTTRLAPGLLVDGNPTRQDSLKYRVTLAKGTIVGIRPTPAPGVSEAVFPISAIQTIEVLPNGQ